MTLAPLSGKPKKCAVRECRAVFVPARPFQSWCSPECGLAIARARQAKERKALDQMERREIKARKQALKGRGEYLKEAQAAFNAWVRARDALLPCISCGRHHQGKYDAGHYRSVGAHPELRFEPLNCHKQCVPCNRHLSGNAIEYRIGLVERIGLDAVLWLEGPHEPKKYSIEEIRQTTALYRDLLKKIKDSVGVLCD